MKRLELIYTEYIIEMRYFEDETERYRSWRLSKSIVNRLIPWWKDVKFKLKEFPVIKSGKYYEFRMDNCKYLYIKEFGCDNNCCKGSWDIPVILIETLSDMEREGLSEKIV